MLGIVKRFAALCSMCLVVATTAQAQAASPVQIIGLDCSKAPAAVAFTTVTCAFSTNVPTTVTVATGTDQANLVSTPDALKTQHVVTVLGLSPNTAYNVLVTAKPVAGAAASQWTTFHTAAPGSAPATVTTQGNRWLLNGQRFIPIMSIHNAGCVTADLVKNDRTMGVEVLLVDETELTNAGCGTVTADQIPLVHAAVDGQMMWWQYWDKPADLVSDPQSPQQAEMIGWPDKSGSSWYVDSMPGLWSCYAIRGFYVRVYADFLAREESAKPLYIAINAVPGGQHLNCLNPARLAWGYWASAGLSPSTGAFWYLTQLENGNFGVDPQLQVEAGVLATQLATLGPVLSYGTRVAIKQTASVSVKIPGNKPTTIRVPSVKLLAWKYGGRLYVLAFNLAGRSSSIRAQLPGVKAGTVEPMFGKTRASLKAGKLSLSLGEAATAWFDVTPAKKK